MNERIAYLIRELYKELEHLDETPYKVGQRLYKEGKGISDIWGAVECDADLDEAQRGYDDAQAKAKARENRKEIKRQLGYSRIGRNNI